ncbi:MAG: DUF5117 domain-containing protein, partial [Candidatus Hinthialibacter sp.]
MISCFASAVIFAPAYGEKEKKADAEITASTAEIESCTQETETETKSEFVEECEEVEIEETEIDNSTNNEVGDVKVYNYGIQAVFINSKVTVNGGTISGEMTKTTGAAAPSEKPAQKPSGNGAPAKPSNGEKPEKPGKFDELIKDATKAAGLFTLYTRKDDKIYWEIKPDQLKQEFLVSGKLATGLGAGRVKPGAYLGGMIVHFRKIDDKLQLMQKNIRFTADEGSKTEAALKKNYQDSIVASFPVEATNPEDSGCLVEMSKFLLTDIFNLGPDVNQALSGGYGFDRSESYVKESKVFPENIVVRTSYAFRSSGSSGSVTVPSPGSAQLDILVDVRSLKDNPDFQPRIADQRIGHFVDAQVDFSNKERISPFNLMINKWDIRKASPDLKMSPPVEPVVVWIENTVPEKYRKAIRDGVLEWNKAFAKIGVQDALVVKQQPDDAQWDAADARYNTIHWNESYDMEYSGVSQWISDPRTGEILQGNFLLEADVIRNLLAFRQYREPDRMDLEKGRQAK